MSNKNIVWSFVKKISNLNFSIIILLSIAAISMIGTIIEQDQSLAYYQLNYPLRKPVLYFFTWKQIINLGLDHIYSNYVFLFLVGLFFLTLIACTFSTQLPMLNQARRWKFFYNNLPETNMVYSSGSLRVSFVNFVYIMNLHNYYVFHKNQAIYAYKGLLGRIAPIFVHFSIVVTLVGAIISLSTGFLSQEIIPVGEIFHIQNIVKAGSFSSLPNNFVGKVNDFYMTHNDDNSIRQFFSDVVILDDKGNLYYSSKISVNHPLKFSGITLYQTNWQLNAIRIQLGDNLILEKSLKAINLGDSASFVWGVELNLDQVHKVFVVLNIFSNGLVIYNQTGDVIANTEYGVWNIFYGAPVIFKDLMPATGLQIKIDPGVSLAYLGFLILMLSMSMSYVSYSQIWANNIVNQFYFCGKTNRALLAFEDEILSIAKKYQILLKSM